MELQLQLGELCGTHDRVIISNHLFNKLNLLRKPPARRLTKDSFPIYPCTHGIEKSYVTRGEVFPEDMEYGYRPIVPRNSLEGILDRWDLNDPIPRGDAGYL